MEIGGEGMGGWEGREGFMVTVRMQQISAADRSCFAASVRGRVPRGFYIGEPPQNRPRSGSQIDEIYGRQWKSMEIILLTGGSSCSFTNMAVGV